MSTKPTAQEELAEFEESRFDGRNLADIVKHQYEALSDDQFQAIHDVLCERDELFETVFKLRAEISRLKSPSVLDRLPELVDEISALRAYAASLRSKA